MIKAYLGEVIFSDDGSPSFFVAYENKGKPVGKWVRQADLEDWNNCRYELVLASGTVDHHELCKKGLARRVESAKINDKAKSSGSDEQKSIGRIVQWLRNLVTGIKKN